MHKRVGWLVAFLAFALPAVVQAAPAPTTVNRDQRYALFKRTLSPTWVRGANGYLTAPNAGTIGHLSVAGGAWIQDSGEVDPPGAKPSTQVYTNTFSAFVGTSGDVEFGATKKVVTFDDFTSEGLNMEANILHFKARVLKITDWLPIIGVGANAIEVTDSAFQDVETNVDVYAVGTETIKLGPLWLNASVGIQTGLLGNQASDNVLFAAAQINLTRHLLFAAEVVGANQAATETGNVKLGKNAILNLTAALNIPIGRLDLQVGVDAFNAAKSIKGTNLPAKAEDMELGAHVSLTIPLGGIFGIHPSN